MRKLFSKITNLKEKQRQKRRLTIRKKIIGTADRPRICAVKSNKHISLQVIDDSIAKTLFTVSSFGKQALNKGDLHDAVFVGTEAAKLLKSRNISTVVFDRAGYKYTGVIAKLADSIRDGGIKF